MRHFVMDLSENKLGDNVENMKNLFDIIKYLPNNIQYIDLQLKDNNLEDKLENIKYLA